MVLVDDIHGGLAAETVRFGVDGTAYEIDLSAVYAAELRQVLAPFVAAARPISVARGTASPQPSRAGVVAVGTPASRGTSQRDTGQPDTGDPAEMREWARANGFPVGERGRISQEAREAFLATPPQVRAEQAATFAELAELAGTGSAGSGPGAQGVVPRAAFRSAR